MTLSAIYYFASKNAILIMKEGITVYYSKKHVDIAKGISQPKKPCIIYRAGPVREFFHRLHTADNQNEEQYEEFFDEHSGQDPLEKTCLDRNCQ